LPEKDVATGQNGWCIRFAIRSNLTQEVDMMASHLARCLSMCGRLVMTSIGLACLTTIAFAVGNDRALYVGGTLKEFAPPAPSRGEILATILFPDAATAPPKIEGRIKLMSDSEFGFDAERRGVLAIPYKAITSLEYGLEGGRHARRIEGVLLVMRWDPTAQFTKDAHNLLTLVYRDQSGTEQAIVLELGRDLVRPTLEALERRTGKAVEFLNVEACMLFKSNAETCEYGQPSELKGLKRVFVDSSVPQERRKVILSEIEHGNAGLEIVESRGSAEIILRFYSESSRDPRCPCEGGRGEVSLVRADRPRVVLVFTGMKKGIWGKNPAESFGRAFVNAVRSANGLAQLRD
jgi:hypothetical protein